MSVLDVQFTDGRAAHAMGGLSLSLQAMFDGAATARAALSDGVQSVATSLTTTVQTAGAATAAAIASLSSTLLQRDNCPIGQRWNYTANACTPQAVQLAASSGVACNANTAGMILMDNGQLVQCKPGQTAFSPVRSPRSAVMICHFASLSTLSAAMMCIPMNYYLNHRHSIACATSRLYRPLYCPSSQHHTLNHTCRCTLRALAWTSRCQARAAPISCSAMSPCPRITAGGSGFSTQACPVQGRCKCQLSCSSALLSLLWCHHEACTYQHTSAHTRTPLRLHDTRYCDFTVSPPMDMGGDGSTSLLAARSCQYIANTANTTAASGS